MLAMQWLIWLLARLTVLQNAVQFLSVIMPQLLDSNQVIRSYATHCTNKSSISIFIMHYTNVCILRVSITCGAKHDGQNELEWVMCCFHADKQVCSNIAGFELAAASGQIHFNYQLAAFNSNRVLSARCLTDRRTNKNVMAGALM